MAVMWQSKCSIRPQCITSMSMCKWVKHPKSAYPQFTTPPACCSVWTIKTGHLKSWLKYLWNTWRSAIRLLGNNLILSLLFCFDPWDLPKTACRFERYNNARALQSDTSVSSSDYRPPPGLDCNVFKCFTKSNMPCMNRINLEETVKLHLTLQNN